MEISQANMSRTAYKNVEKTLGAVDKEDSHEAVCKMKHRLLSRPDGNSPECEVALT